MIRGQQLIAVFILCVGVAGCVSAPPATPVAAAPPPRPVPVDGTYGGLMQLTRGDAMNCGDQDPITLRVTNHTFSFRLSQPQAEWKPEIIFTATIGADGTFNVQSGTGYMRGNVAGGSMQGEISGDFCGFNFIANRGGI
jgi:hypothetical protein